jgi:hypothetical protein
MARVLIVGCDSRAEDLVRRLRERGHVVRCTVAPGDDGTEIEQLGAEVVAADPGRLGTLLPHLQGVSAVCWLAGDSPRLEALAETLIDTHARGLVCEPGAGAEAARRVADANRVAIEIVSDPEAMAPALDRLLAG